MLGWLYGMITGRCKCEHFRDAHHMWNRSTKCAHAFCGCPRFRPGRPERFQSQYELAH